MKSVQQLFQIIFRRLFAILPHVSGLAHLVGGAKCIKGIELISPVCWWAQE